MKRVQEFEGSIKNGKMTLNKREIVDLWIEALGDGPVTVTIGRAVKNRSGKANRYAWGWVFDGGDPF